MIFRKADLRDLSAVAEIYDRIHTQEEEGTALIGWNRKIYPTRETAESAIRQGDMFVAVDHDTIVASGRLNQEQMPAYKEADWEFVASDDEVMVLHTLTVDPQYARKGVATAFADFYETYAREHGCNCLRIDTNEKNSRARNLYAKLGYREAGTIPCVFQGLPDVQLVCLEKFIG